MPVVDGHIRCSRCRTLKAVSEYSPSAAKNGCGNCRLCMQQYSRAWEKANPDKVKASRRQSYRRDLESARARGRTKQRARRAADPARAREYQRRYVASAPAEAKAKWAVTQAEWRKANPDRLLAYDLKRYDLTVAEYGERLAAQGGRCACCGVAPKRGARRLVVDHDHATGIVRGLVCNTCNTGIGHLGDTLEGLRLAVSYLERAQQPAPRALPAMRINLLKEAN